MAEWIKKWRKLIMICLVLVVVLIVLPTITYITEYNKTKVTVDDVFSIDEKLTEVSKKDFDKYIDFDIYCSELTDPIKENDSVTNGSMKFKVNATKKDKKTVSNTTFTVQIGLAANWVGANKDYQKYTSSNTTVTYGTAKDISISSIKTIWPLSGKLPFTKVKHPDVYVLVKWTEKNEDGKTTNVYTTFVMKYDDIITKDTAIL